MGVAVDQANIAYHKTTGKDHQGKKCPITGSSNAHAHAIGNGGHELRDREQNAQI